MGTAGIPYSLPSRYPSGLLFIPCNGFFLSHLQALLTSTSSLTLGRHHSFSSCPFLLWKFHPPFKAQLESLPNHSGFLNDPTQSSFEQLRVRYPGRSSKHLITSCHGHWLVRMSPAAKTHKALPGSPAAWPPFEAMQLTLDVSDLER